MVEYPGEEDFDGDIGYGMFNEIDYHKLAADFNMSSCGGLTGSLGKNQKEGQRDWGTLEQLGGPSYLFKGPLVFLAFLVEQLGVPPIRLTVPYPLNGLIWGLIKPLRDP